MDEQLRSAILGILFGILWMLIGWFTTIIVSGTFEGYAAGTLVTVVILTSILAIGD